MHLPKAADFQIGCEEVAVQHEVLQSQISVEDALLMAVLHAADELLEESAHEPQTFSPQYSSTVFGDMSSPFGENCSPIRILIGWHLGQLLTQGVDRRIYIIDFFRHASPARDPRSKPRLVVARETQQSFLTM